MKPDALAMDDADALTSRIIGRLKFDGCIIEHYDGSSLEEISMEAVAEIIRQDYARRDAHILDLARAEALTELAKFQGGGGWRPVTEDEPADDVPVQLRMTPRRILTRYRGRGWDEWGDVLARLYYVKKDFEMFDEWRPHPDPDEAKEIERLVAQWRQEHDEKQG